LTGADELTYLVVLADPDPETLSLTGADELTYLEVLEDPARRLLDAKLVCS
jgi:hypothetical protein